MESNQRYVYVLATKEKPRRFIGGEAETELIGEAMMASFGLMAYALEAIRGEDEYQIMKVKATYELVDEEEESKKKEIDLIDIRR